MQGRYSMWSPQVEGEMLDRTSLLLPGVQEDVIKVVSHSEVDINRQQRLPQAASAQITHGTMLLATTAVHCISGHAVGRCGSAASLAGHGRCCTQFHARL